MPDKPIKSKGDRVKESVTILGKLKELGIADTDPGYLETKKHLDTWLNGGESWSGRVDFIRYGRRAELILPIRADRISSMKILAPNK